MWIGAGPLGADDGRVALCFRDRASGLLVPAARGVDPPEGRVHDAIREHLAARGASFWPDLVVAAGTADERTLLRALWDLVWAGEVTNDTLAPLRAFVRGGSTRPGRAARARGRGPGRCGGRDRPPAPDGGRSSRALAADAVAHRAGARPRASSCSTATAW